VLLQCFYKNLQKIMFLQKISWPLRVFFSHEDNIIEEYYHRGTVLWEGPSEYKPSQQRPGLIWPASIRDGRHLLGKQSLFWRPVTRAPAWQYGHSPIRPRCVTL
jgi:hypothetical protein